MVDLPPSKRMGIDELVRKIISGERDFWGIIACNINLSAHESYKELQSYLDKQDFVKCPLEFSYSDLSNLVAENIRLPFLKAKYAIFRHANLKGACLKRGNFRGANFANANLLGPTSLYDAFFADTLTHGMQIGFTINAIDADFENSHVDWMNIFILYMRGAINLDKTKKSGYRGVLPELIY